MGSIVISLKLGAQEGDPLGGMLFTLVHLHVLHPIIAAHPTCVFPSLANDMDIVGPTSNVVHVFFDCRRSFQQWGFQCNQQNV
jgi:hypothetical protein